MKKLKKVNIKNFFEKNFSFEHGVDLNDEVEVLYRRNIVIKNIIFVSNIVYSIILFIVSIGEPGNGNWLWTVVPLPLTFVINKTINKIINSPHKDLMREEIAMYMCSFYMFLSAILVYLKLTTGADTKAYSEAGYMLLYYALVVVSLYQDTKMLKNVYGWMFAIVTIIHFTLTHNFSLYAKNGFWDFLTNGIHQKAVVDSFRDIFFRSIVMGIFMLAIYVITSIGEKMSEERKTEIVKRKEIQDDFTNVVTDLYDVLLETQVGYDDNQSQLPLLKDMSFKLASLYGLPPTKCEEISNYTTYNKDHALNLKEEAGSDEKFLDLREQTGIGARIAKRMQLSQKSENIVRAHIEGWATDEFKVKMLAIQNNLESEVILLCSIYINLRSAKSYKRPYPHKLVMEYFDKEFSIYFNKDLYERFVKFNSDFEKMYNEYE